ncbi:Dyp-type peroxidase [Micromonospora sp. CPCC 206060]|uniref:Dyp-type peroxidase n=1 Tax=Micromonospora sp. CPCC 206060 TaxID=3122406 RepID=UPI002FF01195
MTGDHLPGGVRRRAVLGTTAGLTTLAGIGPLAGCGADGRPVRADAPALPPPQPGIVTIPPAALLLAAYDLTVTDRSTLAGLLRRLTARVTATRQSGSPTGLTVTLAVGASLFDGRFGLADRRPEALTTMPAFPNDVLDPGRCHGDLLVQVCAAQADLTRAVEEDLRRSAGDGLRVRWRIGGFRPENGTNIDGNPSTRNLFGFREGAGNPDAGDDALMRRLVWVDRGDGGPEWTQGGTYQVVRLIRMATALWNADPPAQQEAIFGRHRDSGAPLGHGREGQSFGYTDDPEGRMIRLDAHIRRADPRTRRPPTVASCGAVTRTGSRPTPPVTPTRG